ncbi:RNA polymerase recycling motor HelD [Paenibacillus sp. HB172176]|uniref:RNA polymerase recycling motor HelD n=1 Tax=Paenibacillus sp. HB172176 TaxID=2493690 RepID=UPI003211F834
MNLDDERRYEQQRVEEVSSLIISRMNGLENQAVDAKGEIVDIRKNFWDDVTINFEDAAESAETHASLKQQAELLSERERRHRHNQQQLRTLQKLAQSPYFGRIDVSEESVDDTKPQRIYLGVGSLLDDRGEHYLIYDWRAPISSLYYDYGPGPVAYETPSGTIQGEMHLKRQFIIRGAAIKNMFDTGVTIGDELLQEVLGKQSDAQMRSIVATIQHEQNQIIRDERAKLLLVQGAAGSGKTSAALQRIAYLLYRYRETLQADQIVLFSPNPMFNSYISTVLPELGEQNMQQTTYQQYLEHRLGGSFSLEDPFTQLEYTLTAQQDNRYCARIAGIKLKSSQAFMSTINDYVAALGEAGLRFKAIRFRGRVLVSEEELTTQFYSLNKSTSIPNRIRQLSAMLLKQLTALGKLERKKKWVDNAVELLDPDAYADAYEMLSKKNKFTEQSFNDFESERDFLAAKVVQQKFKKLRRQVKQYAFLDMPRIYNALFQPATVYSDSPESEQWRGICESTLERLDAGIMSYEDATPYLFLLEKLEGFHTNTTVKHVFIDEAQDYTPFQFHYLRHIFPRSKMTVLGDFNQSIFIHGGEGDYFHALADSFEAVEVKEIVLSRSYRSTRQIVEFTKGILARGEHIIPFNRQGPQPVVQAFQNESQSDAATAGKLAEWKEAGYASLAVIAKTAKASKEIYARLKPIIPQLKLIEQETVSFERGIVVIPSYLAKGVEFDAVWICDASSTNYGLETERKLFYTACTRAMHELQIGYTGKMTPFLEIAVQSAPF